VGQTDYLLETRRDLYIFSINLNLKNGNYLWQQIAYELIYNYISPFLIASYKSNFIRNKNTYYITLPSLWKSNVLK